MDVMPNINKYRIAVMVLAVVVVALAVILFTKNGGTPTTEDLLTPGTSTTNVATVPAPAANNATQPTGGGTGSNSPTAVTGFVIRLLTPIAGQTWIFAQQNTVSWDRAANVPGQIELLDATTKALVGVILPQTGPNQTSYTWNTRDLLLSRTSPAKKTVTPGSYRVRVSFDGNNLSPVTSGVITISQ